MPIRPEMRTLYPPNWDDIAYRIKARRARWRCECRGECGRPVTHRARDGRCGARHGDRSDTGGRVILTTAHLEHDPTKNEPEDLRALCAPCHLAYDAAHHAATRRATERAARLDAGQGELW